MSQVSTMNYITTEFAKQTATSFNWKEFVTSNLPNKEMLLENAPQLLSIAALATSIYALHKASNVEKQTLNVEKACCPSRAPVTKQNFRVIHGNPPLVIRKIDFSDLFLSNFFFGHRSIMWI